MEAHIERDLRANASQPSEHGTYDEVENAEDSHQPTRQRERTMRRFKSPGHAKRFRSAFGPIREHVCPRRHRLKADEYRRERTRRFLVWNEVTGLQLAAQASSGRAQPRLYRSRVRELDRDD